jgi:GT2 family glycosyltransferase
LKYIYLQRDELSCRSRTRNFGCKLCEGEYIVFIDSDILVRENYLSELERCFSVRKDMAVMGARINLKSEIPYESVADQSVFDQYSFDKVKSDMYEVRHFMFRDMSYNSYCGISPWLKFFTCNVAVPKYWFDKIGGFDEKYKGWGMEDNDLGYRFLKEGIKIIVNSKLEVIHQFHENSNSLKTPADRTIEYHRNIDYFIGKFPEAFANIPRTVVYDLFDGKEKDIPRDRENFIGKVYIKFDEVPRLEGIKTTILHLSERDNLDIVVEDFVENTDLDIWIQLLNNPRSIPKYYPTSKALKCDFE